MNDGCSSQNGKMEESLEGGQQMDGQMQRRVEGHESWMEEKQMEGCKKDGGITRENKGMEESLEGCWKKMEG